MDTYLIFDTYDQAHSRADAEGLTKGLPYWTHGPEHITRRLTDPRETADGKWALEVSGYTLTPEEEANTIENPEWPIEDDN